jgi:hypothetical protein
LLFDVLFKSPTIDKTFIPMSSSKSNNNTTNCSTDMSTRSGRYVLAATILASTMPVSPTWAFQSAQTSSRHHIMGGLAPTRRITSQPAQDEVRGSAGLLSLLSAKTTIPETTRWRPNPVVVSAEAEALESFQNDHETHFQVTNCSKC